MPPINVDTTQAEIQAVNPQMSGPQDASQIHPGILNQTLGELLQNNTHAQGMVMKAMQISPEQLQQMLAVTGNNQFMNMTIGELFKNGFMQQAATGQMVQLSPQQSQQIIQGVLNTQNPQQFLQGDTQQFVPVTYPAPKPSLLEKLKNLFR